MTVKEIKLLLAFNAWASNRIFDALDALPAETLTTEMRASHGSMFGTMVHYIGAEKMWLSRWIGRPDAAFLAAANVPSLADLRALWNTVGFETAKLVAGMDDRRLQETFEMTTSKGTTFRHAYWQAMLHMVDHSTYHRGQVVTMLRQAGITPPSTSMIMFFREAGKLQNN